jgi:hypothetical protein
MDFTVNQRNAGVDFVKKSIQKVEDSVNLVERSFIPKFTDAQILAEVDQFLAVIAKTV